jgi:hypothetical protein
LPFQEFRRLRVRAGREHQCDMRLIGLIEAEPVVEKLSDSDPNVSWLIRSLYLDKLIASLRVVVLHHEVKHCSLTGALR